MKKSTAAAAFLLRVGCAPPRAPGAPDASAAAASATVAADGSGQYASLQDAINAAPQTSGPSSPWTIRVKAGAYRERVYVQREKRFVRVVGEDPARTTVFFDLYAAMTGPDGKPIGTFHTPTLWIDADDFSVEGLTISNTAGRKGQALALRGGGDRLFRGLRHPVRWRRLHHGPLDAGRPALRPGLLKLPDRRGHAGGPRLPGQALAPLWKRRLHRHPDDPGGAARGLAQLGQAGAREDVPVRRIRQ